MNYLDKLEETVGTLSETFPEHRIKWKTHEFGGTVHIFYIEPNSIDDLQKDWENITSAIAGNFQTQLKSEYEIWNVYLFFVTTAAIDPQIKYKIENDTFSSRKIVIEDGSSEEKILENHILNSNLAVQLNINNLPADIFQADPLIFGIVNGKILKYKKRTGEAELSFSRLLDALKKIP